MNLYEMSRVKEIFQKHKKIALDIDHTLIGNSRAKIFLWDYISKNPYSHEYYLVTFRFGVTKKTAFSDIEKESGLGKKYFKDIFFVPDSLVEEYEKLIKNKYIMNEKIDYQKIMQLKLWKASICKMNKCFVLVDDLTEFVLPGCLAYGIEYYHPDDLVYPCQKS